jgi:hypothetical protein
MCGRMMSSLRLQGNKTCRVQDLLLPIGIYGVGALVFFRWQIFSKFDLIFGDRVDARMVAFLHEHLYQWIVGNSSLLSPPFFYNQTDTLGYTDAFLLDQIIYTPLRLLDVGPLLSLSLIAVVLSSVSYFFLYVLLRRLEISALIASLVALLFVFPNNLFLQSEHLQQFTVYYLPIIAYCTIASVIHLHAKPYRAYFLGACAGGLYGLVFSTGYYVAWFFGIGLLIFALIAAPTAWPRLRAMWVKKPSAAITLGMAASISFLSALTIFFIIYAPVLELGAKRPFAEYLFYAPRLNDIINVGSANFFWSKLIRSLHLVSYERLNFIEVNIALTPLIQVFLVTSACLAVLPRFWPASDLGRVSRALVLACTTVCLLFFIVTVKIGGQSLFRLAHEWLPGANVIHAGYRAMVVANLFAVIPIGLTFNQIFRSQMEKPGTFFVVARPAALIILLVLGAVEQVNLSQPALLSRNFEREHLDVLPAPPRECRTFYAVAQAGRHPLQAQIGAMMVAMAHNLPTINGYSGWSPPGWDFYDTQTADYEHRAQRWAVKRGIEKGLCRLDLDRGSWTVLGDGDLICARTACIQRISFEHSHEFEINFGQGGNGAQYVDDHWAEPESWGQWTDARQATYFFSIATPRNLEFALTVRPLLSSERPKQSVWIDANQCRVGSFDFDLSYASAPHIISGTIPANCINADGKVVLRIDTDGVRTPKDLGLNEDTRALGVGIETLVLRSDFN